MKPTLAQLEAFHAVVEQGGVHAAAERLNLSPPTISVRIRMLEQCLERRLFERRGRQIVPTAAGAALVDDVRQMIRLARRVARSTSPRRIRLRLGAFEGFAMVCLPPLLERIERSYPELTVDITIDNSLVLHRKIKERKLDFSFLSLDEAGDGARFEDLGMQDAAWLASPKLGLGRRVIGPEDLVELPIFTHAHPSGLHKMVHDWFRSRELEPTRINTCNSLMLILELTAAGAGISLLPFSVARAKLRSNALERLAVRPEMAPQRVFAAYHEHIDALDVSRFLAIARCVAASTRFLTA
jgi:DNA-binding transcriptional LysR family regulator